MSPAAVAFLSTLLGAFLGVSAPLVAEAIRERRQFRRALDAVFTQCEGYVQGVSARGGYVLQALPGEGKYRKDLAVTLVSQNFEPPEDLARLLGSAYASFVRPSDLFLLAQSEQNLRLLVGNLRPAAEANRQALATALGGLREHAARRAWIVWGMARGHQGEFTLDGYNALIEQLNGSTDRRITSIRHAPKAPRLPPPGRAG